MIGDVEQRLFTACVIKDLEQQMESIIPVENTKKLYRYMESSAKQLIRDNTQSAKLFLLDATDYIFKDEDEHIRNGGMFTLNRYVNMLAFEYVRRSTAS